MSGNDGFPPGYRLSAQQRELIACMQRQASAHTMAERRQREKVRAAEQRALMLRQRERDLADSVAAWRRVLLTERARRWLNDAVTHIFGRWLAWRGVMGPKISPQSISLAELLGLKR